MKTDEEKFGPGHPGLFHLIGRSVDTPGGPGILLSVFAARCEVYLDSDREAYARLLREWTSTKPKNRSEPKPTEKTRFYHWTELATRLENRAVAARDERSPANETPCITPS